jgi:hypothetical protein
MSKPPRRLIQLALVAACVGLVPASTYGQSLRDQLLGTWTIVSAARVVGGVEEPDFLGPDPVGRFLFALMVTSASTRCAEIAQSSAAPIF